jgi:hypothetical protein
MKFECKICGKIEERLKVSFVFQAGSLIPNIQCCGEYMEDITEVIPMSEKNIIFGRFSSMSLEDKQKMLKKRATDHYKKKIKPEKEATHQEIARQVKNVNKHGVD